MALADRKGLWTYATYGNLAMLRTRIAHGVPVIVELVDDPAYPRNRRFAVAVGYDEVEKRVLCHEGRGRPHTYGDTAFQQRWLPVRSWMLVIAPPSGLAWDLSPAELATRARFYESRNQLDLALQDLASAMAADPLNSRICVSAANLYRKLEQPEKAEGLYRRAIDLNPREGQAFNNLAYLKAEHNGDLVDAEALAREALLLEPTNPVSLDTLGYILYLQGRHDEAAANLEQACVRARHLPALKRREITLHLARCYRDGGQPDRAERLMHELMVSDASFTVPDDLRALAPATAGP
jgi:Tfp pilus assembly protein PilF